MTEDRDDNLLERFKQGDKTAANELLGEYFDRIVRAASRRIADRRLRATAAEDIAVSVLESLWKKADQQQFKDGDLTSVDEFWRLLCTMIRFKAEDHVRREKAEKRGGGMLRGESVFQKPGEDSLAGLAGFSSQELSDTEKVVFADEHARMMDKLGEEALQEIVTRRMEGQTVAEIAEHFGKSDRWVKRKLALIRQIWSSELSEREQV